MPKGVVFLLSFHEAIKDLPDMERLSVYDAVVHYGLYGEVIEMSPVARSLFALMKPVIDSSQRKYTAARENGRKGGRPSKNQVLKQTENQTENHDSESDSEYEKETETEMESDEEVEAEREVEVYGGGGNTAFSPYSPLSEAEFENRRAERQRLLDSYMKGD